MGFATGGSWNNGAENLGLPSGGGTYFDGAPGPLPGEPGFIGPLPQGHSEPTSPDSGRSGWSDVFKNLAIVAGQTYIYKKLGGGSGPGSPSPTPNNKGNRGSEIERIPEMSDIPEGTVDPSPGSMLPGPKTLALILAAALVAGVLILRR